jgi:DNA-directed RNA polymerase specialized sigma24 family protein
MPAFMTNIERSVVGRILRRNGRPVEALFGFEIRRQARTPIEEAASRELVAAFDRAMASLPKRDQAIMHLHLDGLSSEMTAHRIWKRWVGPDGASRVRKALQRIRGRLRRLLGLDSLSRRGSLA